MKTLIFLSSIFYFQFSIGQTNVVRKKDLLNALIKEKHSSSKTWVACNDDEVFFKNDTIIFYENSNNNCKKRISWSFENSKSFWQSESEFLGYASKSNVMTKDDHFKIQLTEIENETLLRIYNTKIENTFIVKELMYDNDNNGQRMTLIRKIK